MKTFRIPMLALVALLALILPFSGAGSIGIHLIAPAALGVMVSLLFSERSILIRALIVSCLIIGVAVARISWDAIVLNNGDWRFDGEVGLVVMSVFIQCFVAAIALVGSYITLQGKSRSA